MSKTLGKMSQCSQGVQCSQGHPSRVFLNRKSRETLFASYEVSKSSMAPGMGHSPRELLGLPRKGILGNKFMGFLGITWCHGGRKILASYAVFGQLLRVRVLSIMMEAGLGAAFLAWQLPQRMWNFSYTNYAICEFAGPTNSLLTWFMSVVPSELHFLPDWKLTEGPASMLMVVILALKNEEWRLTYFHLRA